MLILIDLPFGSLALEQFSLLMSHNLSSKMNAGESNTWLLIVRYSCKFHTAGLLCQTNPLLRVSSAGAPWGSELSDISINFFPLTAHSELSALSSTALEWHRHCLLLLLTRAAVILSSPAIHSTEHNHDIDAEARTALKTFYTQWALQHSIWAHLFSFTYKTPAHRYVYTDCSVLTTLYVRITESVYFQHEI